MGLSQGLTRLRQAAANLIGPSNISFTESKAANYSMNVNDLHGMMSQPIHELLMSSQPVWGPEIGVHSGLSEGYSSVTFKKPWVDFASQALFLQEDEDVQLAINHLASQITGEDHYWKAKKKEYADYMTDFSKKIWFDVLDTEIVKELLWYGNCVLIPLLPIAEIRKREDLLLVPISSFLRIWIDRLRKPYKYEFRGSEWQGYMNPQDVIHLKWNPVNGSPFGTGFGVAMTAAREFEEIVPGGTETRRLPNMVERKLSTQFTMQIAQKRYITRNVYNAPKSSVDDRAALKASLKKLEVGEDLVTGVKVEVQELGSAQRAFDPTPFTDLTQGPIFKALNDFQGKQGSEESHQYANAKESSKQVETGLASFPLAVTLQLMEYLFKPWYKAHPIYDMEYGGGIVSVPWDECKFELNFGQEVKRDLDPEQHMKLLELLISSQIPLDPNTILELFEDAGLAIRQETKDMLTQQYQDPDGMLAMNNAMQNGAMHGNDLEIPPSWDTSVADQAPRPMDESNQYTPSNSYPTPRFPFSVYDPKLGDPMPSLPYRNFGAHSNPVQYTKKAKISTKPFV